MTKLEVNPIVSAEISTKLVISVIQTILREKFEEITTSNPINVLAHDRVICQQQELWKRYRRLLEIS